MTPKHRKAVLAKIHLAVQQIGWSDEQYRDALWAQFAEGGPAERTAQWRKGQPSAKDLTPSELDALVRFLQEKGFRPKAAKRAGRQPPRQSAGKEAFLGKIEALLAEKS